MSVRVRLFVAAICLATLALAAALHVLDPRPSAASIEGVLIFAALGLFAELQNYHLSYGATGSISFLPFLTAALLAPNWIGFAAVAAAHAISQLSVRQAPIKRVFNLAQRLLALSVAILAYRLLGGSALIDRSPEPLAYGALFLAYLAVNTFAVSTVIALSDRRRILEVWRANTLGTLVYDVLSLPFVYLFGWVYLQFGVMGALGVGVPLFGVRQLYKTNRQLENVNQELLQLMVAAIEARDPYTSGHSRRVAKYARVICRAIGLTARQAQRIEIAALLHDVGKIHEIYAPILRKDGALTGDERAIMETHPIKSAELIQHVSQLRDIMPSVRHHHENWDGTGYPDGLAADEIPLGARVIMLADTIDAMTTDRPYRGALSIADVKRELQRLRGRQFDPQICDAVVASDLFDSMLQGGADRHATPIASRYAPGLRHTA
jgi:hypothetical protein